MYMVDWTHVMNLWYFVWCMVGFSERKCLGKNLSVQYCPLLFASLCRTTHFFASADKAKRELDWKPQHNFLSDVESLVQDYQASGRASQMIDFEIDDKIIAACAPAQ